MIPSDRVHSLYNWFAQIFYYGFRDRYSLTYMEENIANSRLVSILENGGYEKDIDRFSFEEYIYDIYKEQIKLDSVYKVDDLSIWVGEAYLRLFYHFNKSFSYIFLYFPISLMVDSYGIYHEMDFSQLYDYFTLLTQKKSLLSLLLKKKGLTINNLSVLTGISVNTIKYYCKSEKNIYDASFENITDVAHVLDVNVNIFKNRISNFTYSGHYNFDKTNKAYRSALGYFLACYFSKEINEEKYKYNQKDNIYKSNDNYLKVIWSKTTLDDHDSGYNAEIESSIKEYIKTIKSKDIPNTTLVVFEFNQISKDYHPYTYLNKYGFKKILILNVEYCLEINKTRSSQKYIRDDVNSVFISRAKALVGGDFAF